jgi:RimJ/RimL family protein N-acetyltransferase
VYLYLNMENVFRSRRLIYRAIENTAEDAEFMHRIQSDPVAFSNSDNSLLVPMTYASSGAWKKSVQENKLIGVLICIAPTDALQNPPVEPIGCISLTGAQPGVQHHRNSYISIDIVKPHQRKGYGTEAITWVLDWGFKIAGLHRIGIECFSYNKGAKDLYERLGFVFEGMKRECIWYNGGWEHLLSFSMLESEWKELRK